MLKFIRSLDIAVCKDPTATGPLWLFTSQDDKNHTLHLARKWQVYISFMTEKQREYRNWERKEAKYARRFIAIRRTDMGTYLFKVGRRELALTANHMWRAKGNTQLQPRVETTHTSKHLNTELFLGRHSLIVSTLR